MQSSVKELGKGVSEDYMLFLISPIQRKREEEKRKLSDQGAQLFDFLLRAEGDSDIV